MPNKSVAREDSPGQSGLILASGTMVSRLLGFFAAILLARTLGTTGDGADAFALANQLPNNIYALIAGGILTAILVPQVVAASASPDGGQAFVNKIVTLGATLFLGIAVLATLAAPLLVGLYAQSGQRGFSPEALQLAIVLAYWCLPQILFYALYSLLSEVLNARKVFGPFTWAPVVNNLIFIAGLVVFTSLYDGVAVTDASRWSGSMVGTLGGFATAGIALQAAVLVLFWRRTGLGFRPDFRWRGVGLHATGKQAAWLFGMILLTQLAGIVQANIASLATADGEAGLAILRFSWLVFMLPHSVITVSLATAYFTRMATHVRDGDTPSLVSDLLAVIGRVGFFVVLAQAGLLAVALPFARVFTDSSADVPRMALVLACYSAGLIPFTLVFLLQRAFFANDDTKRPFALQLIHTTVFLAGSVLLLRVETPWLAAGIALATSSAALVQALVGSWWLSRRVSGLTVSALLTPLLPFLGAGIVSLGGGVGVLWLLGGLSASGFARVTTAGALSSIGLIATVMIALYVLVLLLLRNHHLAEVGGGVVRVVRRVLPGRE